jgi:hypothetical protein
MDAKDVLHLLRTSHNPSVVGSIPTGPTLQTITQVKIEVRKTIFEILRSASHRGAHGKQLDQIFEESVVMKIRSR